MNMIYLDNNATTKVSEEVVQAMLPYFSEYYGNPSSMYAFALPIASAIKKARQQVAQLLNANSSEIIFTSGGTESDNTAIFGTLAAFPHKKHIIVSAIEHPAVLNIAEELQRRNYEVTIIPVDHNVLIDPREIEKAIRPDTAIVSVMWANNETGTIIDIEAITKIVKSKNVLMHTDAVQAAGKLSIDLQKVPVDLLSLSGHKLHAPKGVGALYAREGTRIRPFLMGGHQEHGRRAGTENVQGIVGLGVACEQAFQEFQEKNQKITFLRDKLEKKLLEKIPHSHVNGSTEHRVNNTTNIAFEFVEGESILLMMSDAGICASSGSACTSGSLESSHVLRAAGIPAELAHSAVRFSLSKYNTESEIDYVIETLPGIIAKLRAMSPFA